MGADLDSHQIGDDEADFFQWESWGLVSQGWSENQSTEKDWMAKERMEMNGNSQFFNGFYDLQNPKSSIVNPQNPYPKVEIPWLMNPRYTISTNYETKRQSFDSIPNPTCEFGDTEKL